MDSIKFISPVYVGDIITLYTSNIKVGNTSVQVTVDAVVQRRDRHGVEIPVTTSVVTLRRNRWRRQANPGYRLSANGTPPNTHRHRW